MRYHAFMWLNVLVICLRTTWIDMFSKYNVIGLCTIMSHAFSFILFRNPDIHIWDTHNLLLHVWSLHLTAMEVSVNLYSFLLSQAVPCPHIYCITYLCLSSLYLELFLCFWSPTHPKRQNPDSEAAADAGSTVINKQQGWVQQEWELQLLISKQN